MAELYTKTCKQCRNEYTTEKRGKQLCPACVEKNEKKRKDEQRAVRIKEKPVAKKKPKKAGPTLAEVSYVEKVYNAVNGTYKHYHDIVNIIEAARADRCVCCGATIPEGRMVCHACELKAEEAKQWWRKR